MAPGITEVEPAVPGPVLPHEAPAEPAHGGGPAGVHATVVVPVGSAGVHTTTEGGHGAVVALLVAACLLALALTGLVLAVVRRLGGAW